MLALLVAGCGSLDAVNPFKKKTAQACPRAIIVHEASRLVAFRPGAGRDMTDVLFEARLPRISVACDRDDNVVTVDSRVAMIAERGPANTNRKARIRYFVAVVDSAQRILNKGEFETELEFPTNVNRGQTSEELTQRIPIASGAQARDYTIMVGFQLTPEQLAYNRASAAGGTSLINRSPVRIEEPMIDTGGIDNRPVRERNRYPLGP